MKITRRTSIQTPALSETAPLGGATPKPGGTPASGDSVELSDTARLFQRLRGEVGDVESMVTDQVRELQQRVQDGAYRPAPRTVAERFLTELASDLVA